jgi:hypothetical protein
MARDEDEQPKRGFKVEDRRRFTGDGESAPEREAEPAAAAAPPPSGSAAPAAGESYHDHHDHHGHDHHDHDHADHGHGEINFATFVMGLTTQALMHLGEIAEQGQPSVPDLPAAKQMIDLLGILREKTKGNLDPDEDQLLASMLYDLRMRYVEVARQR